MRGEGACGDEDGEGDERAGPFFAVGVFTHGGTIQTMIGQTRERSTHCCTS